MPERDQPRRADPEIVELLIGCDGLASNLNEGRLVHLDGRLYSPEDTRKILDATHEDQRAAASLIMQGRSSLTERQHDQRQLNQLASRSPEASQARFVQAVNDRKRASAPRKATTREILRSMDQGIADLVDIFRQAILPDLAGDDRVQALIILDRLAPDRGSPS
jgi:hypothetical protein